MLLTVLIGSLLQNMYQEETLLNVLKDGKESSRKRYSYILYKNERNQKWTEEEDREVLRLTGIHQFNWK